MKVGFGQRLKTLRTDNNLTQKKLAQDLSVAESTLACWESEIRQCDYQSIIAIAKYFGVPTDYLFGLIDEY